MNKYVTILLISAHEHRGLKYLKVYSIGNSIVLPHVRYVNHGGRLSIMFHTDIIWVNGHYRTLGCDRMDVSGFCLGHKMSRDEFLERYCGGIEPEVGRDKNG